MAVFTWTPSFDSSEASNPRVAKAQMGDGYEQRVRMGLQTDPKVWTLQFDNRTDAERDQIRAFLESRGGAEAFNWTTPWGQSDRRWVCEDWGITPSACNLNQIRATFRQVYDWSLITEVGFSRPAWNSGYTQFRPGAQTLTTLPVAPVAWVTSSTTFAASVPWTISNTTTAAWYQASDASTLTIDATGSHAGEPTQWRDKSGNGRHLELGTAGSHPELLSGVLNGKNGIKLINNSRMRFSGSHNIGTSSVVALLLRPESFTAPGNQYIASGTNTGSSAMHCIGGPVVQGDGSNTGEMYQFAGGVDYATSNNAIATGQFFIIIGRFNGPNSFVRVNGLQVGAGTVGYENWSNGIQLGSSNQYGGVDFASNATYVEVAVIAGASDVATIEKIEGSWAHQYGLTASLPAGHPYKASPP